MTKRKTKHKSKPKREHEAPTEKIDAKEEELIEEGLDAIYGEEKVDFSKLDRARTRLTSILLTIVITLFVIAVTAWAGFFVYTKYFSAEQEELFELAIDAPAEVVSGEETTIEIQYKNPTSVPIASLAIDARIPAEFVITNTTPLPADEIELTWEIGTLAAGSDGVIRIEGIWIAEAPSSTPVQVFADFRPSNFNADFQDIETFYVNTLSSTLTSSFEGPEEAHAGQRGDYKLIVKNEGKTAYEHVKINLQLPDGFFLEESEPEVEAGLGTTWNFDVIDVEQEVELNFSGTFAADVEGFQYFDADISIEPGERSLTQATAQAFTDVVGTTFDLQLVANGSTEDIAVDLGDQLRITIAYEHTGEEPLEDLNLLLDFQSEEPMPIIWSEASLDEGVLTSDGITWDSELLSPLEPQDKRVLNLSFPIEEAIGDGQSDTFSVSAVVTFGERQIQSSPVQVQVNTEAEFSVDARYFTEEGAPLGNGPIPPQAGETTTYRVFWNIQNSLHSLEDVQVSAVLPPHVIWQDQAHTDLGSLSYDPISGTVRWTISNLPTTIDDINADFALSITPDESDVGTFVKLISGSTLSATDAVTDVSIQKTTESLSTDLQNDEFAADKGAVVE